MFGQFVILTLIVFDCSCLTSALIDLFKSNKGSPYRQGELNNGGSCEEPIVTAFSKFNKTGIKVFRTTEVQLQFCPNICDHSENINKYCYDNEPEYVEAFSASTKSDRCCDERSCKCICHFNCHTFETRAKEFKDAGYKKCLWGTSRNSTLKKATIQCEGYRDDLDCKPPSPNFVCPRQFVCVGDKCLACINPSCITDDDKSKAKELIGAYNKTENSDIEKYRVDAVERAKNSKNNKKGKFYRGLNLPVAETKVEAGVEL